MMGTGNCIFRGRGLAQVIVRDEANRRIPLSIRLSLSMDHFSRWIRGTGWQFKGRIVARSLREIDVVGDSGVSFLGALGSHVRIFLYYILSFTYQNYRDRQSYSYIENLLYFLSLRTTESMPFFLALHHLGCSLHLALWQYFNNPASMNGPNAPRTAAKHSTQAPLVGRPRSRHGLSARITSIS